MSRPHPTPTPRTNESMIRNVTPRACGQSGPDR
jgi:hypothetical protein